MDDVTVGRILRALRRRRGWRQSDLAAAAGRSQSLICRLEAGHIGSSTVETTRAVFAAVEARIAVVPSWRGAEVDRLLDADHASLVAAMAARLEGAGWEPVLKVTYSEFGERGSIDLLGLSPDCEAVLVVEVKSDIPSTEAVGRKLDEKTRLAPGIVEHRFGWRPTTVGRLVVLPEAGRLRRLVARVPTIRRMFPEGGPHVRR